MRIARGLGGRSVVIVEQHSAQARRMCQIEVIGEHAEEDVGAHPAGEAVVDRADFEFDGLE